MVKDLQSEIPLIGATIEWVQEDASVGTTTDVNGYFKLEGITLGRHTFRVSYLG